MPFGRLHLDVEASAAPETSGKLPQRPGKPKLAYHRRMGEEGDGAQFAMDLPKQFFHFVNDVGSGLHAFRSPDLPQGKTKAGHQLHGEIMDFACHAAALFVLMLD